MLTGSGKMLENFIRDKFGVKVRSIELNVNQRCSGMMASATDIEESVLAGRRRKGRCLRADRAHDLFPAKRKRTVPFRMRYG